MTRLSADRESEKPLTPAMPEFDHRLGRPVVRTATPADARTLHRLSTTFVHSGALRERPEGHYARHAEHFLVAATATGTIEGCVALRYYPARSPMYRNPSGAAWSDAGRTAAVVYNFCVAPGSQRRGAGSALLRAVLSKAGPRSVFTATTGSGELFLRHAFHICDASTAPAAWLATLDPRRGSTVLSRCVETYRRE
ncbi:GNAT family N-acetyltransferase [Streptomyces sp. NPDC056672]|uniref:GNAT family N-acetyltransferase n=1 Tax=Streptomyces sp. NPDC056672 TaxID=3345906 RepID=UPI0036B78DEE